MSDEEVKWLTNQIYHHNENNSNADNNNIKNDNNAKLNNTNKKNKSIEDSVKKERRFKGG